MEILLNPVLISVFVMLALCLLKINVMLALMSSAVIGGLVAGLNIIETVGLIIEGMANKNNVALSYILLGAMATAIAYTGIIKILCHKLLRVFKDKRKVTVLIIAGVACLSQNVIPVHIAFIPILIPPLLYVFNKLQIDRRAIACALVFGLKAPYMIVPMGFGLIFGNLVASNMTANGMTFLETEVWLALLIPVLLGMGGGLLWAIFVSYRNPRKYEQLDITLEEVSPTELKMTKKHWLALAGVIICFGTQVLVRMVWNSGLGLHLGALLALVFMTITKVIPFKEMDETVLGGIKLMGSIAFIMLMAGGFAAVMGVGDNIHVRVLVDAIISNVGTNRLVLTFFMMVVGTIVTMGIGTSFGTIPVIAPIFVPLAIAGGFSPMATACLIGTAAAIGDAGSPASDSTLGTSAGLRVDGQHNHIYDTCIPTFLHFDIPLIVLGAIAAAFIL